MTGPHQPLDRVEQILPTLATWDDLKETLKNHPTRVELKAIFPRPGETMRAFVLEVVEKSAADTRREMRVPFERQQTWFHAMLDTVGGVREEVRQVAADGRRRRARLY